MRHEGGIKKWKNTYYKSVKLWRLKRMKRQPTDWEETFIKDISDRELLPKIYKEHLKSNNKKMNHMIKNGQKT